MKFEIKWGSFCIRLKDVDLAMWLLVLDQIHRFL
jgi:hypothetical protein